MEQSELAQLRAEPACVSNQGEKSGCARPKPGATAGGCAFDGAQIVLLPITDVAHLTHGPIACAGNTWDNRGARSSGPQTYRLGLTTDLNELDVIMGRSEERLFHGIRQVIEAQHPAAVFVYNTCVPALIGDDLAAVCAAAGERFGCPVIPVDAAGFYGSKNLGNRIAGETMLRHVVGTAEPPELAGEGPGAQRRIHRLNIIGEFNIAGEFWSVLPVLDELGIRVLGRLSGDARFRDVQVMHRADATMVVCSRALINVARGLEERYGIPWFEGSFYGLDAMDTALRALARRFRDPDLSQRVETVIARERARVREELVPWRERLRGRRVMLYTGGVKSWSVVGALQELGLEVVATGTRKSTAEDKERIRALMGPEAAMIEDGNPRALLAAMQEHGADLMIAGGRNMYTALKARIPFLDINQEREFGYAGYSGMVELARQISVTLTSPIWPAVRSRAPWDPGAALGGSRQESVAGREEAVR